MAPVKFATVDDYINHLPAGTQRVLQRVRRIVRKALPGAQEVISYQILAYRRDGRIALYVAGWRDHYSLYPSSTALEAKFKKELAPYETSGRGTIRFPLAAPVPAELIAAIARFRAEESTARARALKTAVKARRAAATPKRPRAKAASPRTAVTRVTAKRR